jgi:hypothetical protein
MRFLTSESKIGRLGTAVAIAAAFVAGSAPAPALAGTAGAVAGASGVQYVAVAQDHDDRFSRRGLGRNRYRYTYRGRDYDYTVDNRRGSLDTREVAERASSSGYQQGLQDGQYDGSGASSRPNPRGHGAYQFALDGWDPDWGSGVVYQNAYRSAYVRGYNEAFSRTNHGRRPGRRY